MAWELDEDTGSWTYVPGALDISQYFPGDQQTFNSAQDSQLYNANNPEQYMTGGKWDLVKLAAQGLTIAGAIDAFNRARNPPQTGYQGGIPSLTGVRAQTAPPAYDNRPGIGGHRYFSDTMYANNATPDSATAGLAAIKTKAALQGAGATINNNAQEYVHNALKPAAQTPAQLQAAQDQFYGRTAPAASAAQGGLMGLAKGGSTNPRYLRGSTDGMADKIPARIDGQQEAALAHGEFVVPADVVSHLGNGNSDAGAEVLYKMMDKIRKARTGTKKQGKQINPEKFTPGGLAYAAGGVVSPDGTRGFLTGGTVPATPGLVGTESNLSNWAGPYVTDMLGKGQALSTMPYQAYQGPLSAGNSALQTQAYGLAGGLQTPAGIGQAADTAGGIAGATQTSSFNAPGTAQAYMSPYQQQVIDSQKTEAQRMADIATTGRHSQLTQAGAFGGSRGAIMDAEAARNLALQQGSIQTEGMQRAFENAQKQFNTEQTTGLAGFNTQLQAAQAQGNLGNMQNQAGLANLNAMAGLGATQQATQQTGIVADQAAFTQERDNPYKMVQYQQSLLQGMPLEAQGYNIQTNPYYAAAGGLSDIGKTLGLTP